jgi:hypothetical protein
MNRGKKFVAAALFALSGAAVAGAYVAGPFKVTDKESVIHCPATILAKSSGKCYVAVGQDMTIAEWAAAAGFKAVERYTLVVTEAGNVIYVIVVSR